MEWFKKHSDTAVTLGVIFGMITWLASTFSKINDRFNSIEKDIAIIKTVLIMKNIITQEIVSKTETEE